jgi:hypothetical protein
MIDRKPEMNELTASPTKGNSMEKSSGWLLIPSSGMIMEVPVI